MRNILFVMLLAIFFSACENNQTKEKESKTNEKLKVFAVNYPLYYFAERIGGDHIDLIYPIPDDVDPAYWVPYKSLDNIQSCDLILANGAAYAKWMEKVSLPSSKVVNTSESFTDKYIKIEQGSTHSHGAGGEHVHYGFAFTTWLNFKYAEQQANAILDVLVSKRPMHKDIFTANFKELKAELQSLDQEMSALSKKLPEIAVFASHPVYQYLGEAYGLNIISEHWEPGETPSEEQWSEFQHNLEHNPANLMLWEGEPYTETAEKLKGLKVHSIVFSPCANKPHEGDFISTMKKNIENLKKYVDEFC